MVACVNLSTDTIGVPDSVTTRLYGARCRCCDRDVLKCVCTRNRHKNIVSSQMKANVHTEANDETDVSNMRSIDRIGSSISLVFKRLATTNVSVLCHEQHIPLFQDDLRDYRLDLSGASSQLRSRWRCTPIFQGQPYKTQINQRVHLLNTGRLVKTFFIHHSHVCGHMYHMDPNY